MDWSELYKFKNVDEAVSVFNFKFMQIVNHHLPWKRLRVRIYSAPWVNNHYLSLVDSREYWARRHRQKPTAFTQLKKKETRKLCNKTRTELKRDYVRHSIEKYKDDPKRIWRVIREFWPNSQTKHLAINKLHNVSGDKNIAELFNKHFSTVADSLLENIPKEFDETLLRAEKINPPVFEFTALSESDVAEAIKNLSSSKAFGPDGITSFMIKSAHNELLPILTHLFN